MTKNERLFHILDRMFPGEFKYSLNKFLNHTIRIFLTGKNIYPENLEDAFWLADKVGLFDGIRYLYKKAYEEKWEVLSVKAAICDPKKHAEYLLTDPGPHPMLTVTVYGQGDTLQEAIINSIVAIYGEK